MINKNSPRFNRHRYKTKKKRASYYCFEKDETGYDNAALHRLLRKAVMFCTFKKIQELMTAKKRNQEELLVCKRQKVTSAKTGSEIAKEVLICTSCTSKSQ